MKTIIILVVSFTTLLLFSCTNEKTEQFKKDLATKADKTKALLLFQIAQLEENHVVSLRKQKELLEESNLFEEMAVTLSNKSIPLLKEAINLLKKGKNNEASKKKAIADKYNFEATNLHNKSTEITNMADKLAIKSAKIEKKYNDKKDFVCSFTCPTD